MNTTLLNKIIIGIVILGIIVGGYFAFTSNKNEAGIKSEEEATTEIQGKKMAFSQFIKNGGSYECTISQNVAETTSTGKVFMDGEKIRGDFTSTVQNRKIDSTFVSKEGFTYAWTSMIPNMVYKSAMKKEETEANTNTGKSGAYSFDAETIGEYDCKEWATDQTKFEIPAGAQVINI